MGRGRVGASVLAVLTGLAVSSRAPRAADAPGEDPWTGKARADVVQALGEPSKVRRASDGSETLLYMFRRVPPDAPPHPEVSLLHVPGVGLVAKIVKGRTADSLTIEPPIYDEKGRPITTSPRTSYDPGPDNPEVRGNVKVRFELDARGVVRDWSFTGGKP